MRKHIIIYYNANVDRFVELRLGALKAACSKIKYMEEHPRRESGERDNNSTSSADVKELSRVLFWCDW